MAATRDEAFFLDGPPGLLEDPAAVRAALVAAARGGRVLTYSEALAALGFRFSRPKMRRLCRTLGEVDAAGRARGEPELAVLVVRASDGMPGDGWWAGLEGARCGGPGAAELVRERQAAVFAHWRGTAD